VHGYQIEIDPSGRAWSCGIYDEGRRGWLFDLKENPEAQKAFRQNEWNRGRVEARGAHLKTWLNDVSVADLEDGLDSSGFIALQVHGIGSEAETGREIRWRNLRIQELKPESREAGKEVAPSGAWTWFNDPRALVRDGIHDNIGFLEMEDGRLAAFYSTHGTQQMMFMRYALVKTPKSIEDWGEEIAVDWSAKKFRGGVCYNNPFQLKNEPGRVYNFIRGANWNPTLLLS
jgi:hypothetical protein